MKRLACDSDRRDMRHGVRADTVALRFNKGERTTTTTTGHSGYCTVRLRVDDDVWFTSGQPVWVLRRCADVNARDEGSECSQAMPTGSALDNFRFRVVDGRGRVTLAESPTSGNRYTARVRIQDTKGGDEGYTFKVEWENRNPGAMTDTTGFGGRRQRANDNSGWGTTTNNPNSGWGPSASSANSDGAPRRVQPHVWERTGHRQRLGPERL